LSTSRFEGDGVSRGDRSGLGFGPSPSYLQESKLAPAYGFAVESTGVQFLHSRFSYRKVYQSGTAVLVSRSWTMVVACATRSATALRANGSGTRCVRTSRTSARLMGSVVYDLYNRRVSQYDAALDWYATGGVVFGGNLEYFLPTFDADSIFNWFAHRGTTSLTARADVVFSRQFEISGQRWRQDVRDGGLDQ